MAILNKPDSEEADLVDDPEDSLGEDLQDGEERSLDIQSLLPRLALSRPEVISVEEARKLLSLPKTLPPQFYKILGQENIERLLKILADQDNVDLDMLALTEPMGVEVGNQYMSGVPAFQKFRLELCELAKSFVASLMKDNRIRNYVKKSVSERIITKEGKRYKETSIKSDSGIIELFRLITDLEKILLPKGTTFRGGRLSEFVTYFQQLLFIEALKDFDQYLESEFASQNPEWRAKLLSNFIGILKQHSAGRTITQGDKTLVITSVEVLLKVQDSLANCRENHQSTMNKLSDSVNSLEDLKLENDLKAEEIAQRSQMKMVGGRIKRMGEDLFFITSFHTEGHPIGICLAGIIFNSRTPNQGGLHFFLDRADLELYTVMGLYKISDNFEPKACEALRSIFFDMILKELRAKTEDDFEDLFIAPERPEIPETQEMPEMPEEAHVEEIRTEVAEEVATIQEVATPKVVESIADEVNTTVTATIAPAKPKPKRANLSRFRSLSSDMVLTTLTALVGKPVRKRGSHHIFEFNGKSFPIPLHFGGDVNRFILGRALRTWGLMDEFCERIS